MSDVALFTQSNILTAAGNSKQLVSLSLCAKLLLWPGLDWAVAAAPFATNFPFYPPKICYLPSDSACQSARLGEI